MTTFTAPAAPTNFTFDGDCWTHDGRRVGWEIEHAWSIELADRDPRLQRADYSLLMSGVRSALPIVLVTRELMDGRELHYQHTVVVTELRVDAERPSGLPHQGRIRIRYWGGFNHEVTLAAIVSVSTPDTGYIAV